MAIIPKQQPYIQQLNPEWYQNNIATVDMLRLDVIDDKISGNKWYKLKENIKKCQQEGKGTILTFGGGYSNHLVASAVMAKHCGLKSIGIIRGVYDTDTPTITKCRQYGMRVVSSTQTDYKRKNDNGYLNMLSNKYDDAYIIPEGGANEEGRVGVAEIAKLIPDSYTHIAVSVGTGTTLVGIVNNVKIPVVGFAPMKSGSYLNDELRQYINKEKHKNYIIYDNWHHGGFGRYTNELISFMNNFYELNKIPLDMVYTAKMMSGIQQQVLNEKYHKEAKVLCVHTGGLQGNSSITHQLKY